MGSSDTFSSFPRKPFRVLKRASLTDLSGSRERGHNAGRMRLATSDSKKYCCVAAKARIPEIEIHHLGKLFLKLETRKN